MGGSQSKEEATRAAVVSRVEDKEGQVTVEVNANDREMVFNKLVMWGSSPHGRICSKQLGSVGFRTSESNDAINCLKDSFVAIKTSLRSIFLFLDWKTIRVTIICSAILSTTFLFVVCCLFICCFKHGVYLLLADNRRIS